MEKLSELLMAIMLLGAPLAGDISKANQTASPPQKNVTLDQKPQLIRPEALSPLPEEINKLDQVRESLPLIEKIMSREELAKYIKDQSLEVPTKSTFKGAELLLKTEIKEGIGYISSVRGPSQQGNFIVITGYYDTDIRFLLFLDPNGKVINRIRLNTILDPNDKPQAVDHFAISRSGNGAVVVRVFICEPKDEGSCLNHTRIIYYSSSGKQLWSIKGPDVPFIENIELSDNGETLMIGEGNPYISYDGIGGGDLANVKAYFYNRKGKRIFEYGGYSIISKGSLSGNGRYYCGQFCWFSDISSSWEKLVLFDLIKGQVRWAIPFKSALNSEQNDLAISENGSYVAAIDKDVMAWPPEEDIFQFYEVNIFANSGDLVAVARGTWINWINDKGCFEVEWNRGSTINLGCTSASAFLKEMDFSAQFSPSEYLYASRKIAWKGNTGTTTQMSILSLLDEVLADSIVIGGYNFSPDGKHLTGLGFEDVRGLGRNDARKFAQCVGIKQ
jgi:hypothetical protein